ncbi:SHOCT domain-containing protein [Piscinibacter terrae]|uniref:SHOCT domain-containing protein n=1 Tax=Piscinibacter terrae TaxID=2496871 RepID=UPI0018E09A78|nr:SHOCT domain-containing protein [Albitalea terrae]
MNKKLLRQAAVAMALGSVLAASMPAHSAGLLEGLFGNSGDLGPSTQRSWKLAQFTTVKLVEDKESSTANNRHPAQVDASTLKSQLAGIQVSTRDGMEPLFADDELTELVPVLSRALSLAKPVDDVLLVTNARRGSAMSAPKAVTARLFVTADGLNVVVRDTRFSFMGDYINTRIEPKFEYGSRVQAGPASLKVSTGASKRGDWVVVPVVTVSTASASTVATPAQPARAATAATVSTPSQPAQPAVPATPGSPAAIGDEIEQRLITLKRLRDKNLITEEEYQQKRREVLQKL